MTNPKLVEYLEDEKRNQVRCRFYELKEMTGVRQAPIHAICTLDEADFKIVKGVPEERTQEERNDFIRRMRFLKYQELLPKYEEKKKVLERAQGQTKADRHLFQEAIDSYREKQLPKLKKKTADDYENYLKYWEKRLGHLTIAQVDVDCLLEEQDILIETPIKRSDGRAGAGHGELRSGSSVNRYFSTLSAVFTKTIIKRQRWIDSNPCHYLDPEKESKGRERMLDLEEKDLLLATLKKKMKESEGKIFSQSARAKNGQFQGTEPCDPSHLDLAIRLALRTGARQQEIWSMKFRQISFKRSTITFDETKNDNKRTISIPDNLMERLSKLPSRWDKGFVFPSKTNPNKGYDFRKPFNRLLEECGIEDFSWHGFRHTSASYYAMAGTPIITMTEIFGWKDISMVKKYTHLFQEHKKHWMEKMGEEFGV